MLERYFKNLTFRLKAAADRDSGKFMLSPWRDWTAAVILFLAFVFLVAAGSTYLYLKISRDETFSFGTASEAKKEAVTKEKIEQAISYLEEKERRFERLLENKVRIGDPSR